MTETADPPTPRQVLYGLVAGGFLVVAGVLTMGAAVAGVSPIWWTLSMAAALLTAAGWSILNWRRTLPVLLISILLFLSWTIGTLIVS